MLLAMAREPGAEERDDAHVQWVLGASPAGFFNCVVRANLVDDEPIEAFIAKLRDRRIAGTWHLGPSMRPADLARRLVERGFEHAGDDMGMQRRLEDLPLQKATEGLTIERVTSDRQLGVWTRTMVRAFKLPDAWTAWFDRRCRALGYSDWAHFLGRIAGEPVATTTLFINRGVAGIHNVGTLPGARGRGVGSALTLAALHEARARDLDVAVLHASEMGRPIYERLGFQTICVGGMYRWQVHP